jgi:predicted dinucleotide-binding enzyme
MQQTGRVSRTLPDATAAVEVETLSKTAGFDPVRAGGVAASGRIEVGGDLHTAGGLNGRLAVEKEEAASPIATPEQAVS